MSLQFSFDRLGDDTKIAPANVPDHKTAGGRINLLNVHGARVAQQAVNVLSKVTETMDHFGSRWIGNLDLNCCAHRARYVATNDPSSAATARWEGSLRMVLGGAFHCI